MNEKNDESLMADNFLSGQRVKHLVLFIEQHKKIEETKWLADFMENEVAYLIERAEKFRYSFSSNLSFFSLSFAIFELFL